MHHFKADHSLFPAVYDYPVLSRLKDLNQKAQKGGYKSSYVFMDDDPMEKGLKY